jgi:hypothetical protein
VTEGPEHRYVLVERARRRAGGREDLVGRAFADAFRSSPQGFAAVLDQSTPPAHRSSRPRRR